MKCPCCTAAKKLLALMDELPPEPGGQQDRVLAAFEFDELRAALQEHSMMDNDVSLWKQLAASACSAPTRAVQRGLCAPIRLLLARDGV